MKTQDLRLGNLIQEKFGEKRIVAVTAITETWINAQAQDQDLYASEFKNFEPIKLDSKTLKKLGYKNGGTRKINDDWQICFERRKGELHLINVISNKSIKIIYYLHEYQNDYYQLTGNDIKLK